MTHQITQSATDRSEHLKEFNRKCELAELLSKEPTLQGHEMEAIKYLVRFAKAAETILGNDRIVEQMQMPETIRIRAAVGHRSNGEYAIVGGTNGGKPSTDDELRNAVFDALDVGEALVHFIEADIPACRSITVEGTVIAPEKAVKP